MFFFHNWHTFTFLTRSALGGFSNQKIFSPVPKRCLPLSLNKRHTLQYITQVGVLLPLLAIPSPSPSSPLSGLPWSAYLGLLLPLPLTALLLSLLSHLSPYQVGLWNQLAPTLNCWWQESALTWGDSLWTLASVLLLNLPETKIKVNIHRDLFVFCRE